jgi:hypothetical protein
MTVAVAMIGVVVVVRRATVVGSIVMVGRVVLPRVIMSMGIATI